MSVKLRVICIGLLCIFVSFFSGCTLLQSTDFLILSQSIADDNGFPSLAIRFNTTGKITIRLSGPSGSLYEEEFFSGVHDVLMHLDDYWQTPRAGTYRLRVVDGNDNQVFENELSFAGADLEVSDVDYFWWDTGDTMYLTGVEVLVVNTGDLPAYPYQVDTIIESKNSVGYVLPKVVLPQVGEKVTSCVVISDVPESAVDVRVSVESLDGIRLLAIDEEVVPSDSVDDWIFSWRYLGARTIRLPALSFLDEYYRGLERFLSDDYAAYVFDQYDDLYVGFVADMLVDGMGSVSDEQAVNYIASFTQDITYASDDDLDPSCEYPKYPLETLADGKGDCEDKAILTVAILDYLGYDVALLRLPNHMAVGVSLPADVVAFEYFIDEYYFLETTRNRWVVGKVPDEYSEVTNITTHLITDRAILLHTWTEATRYTTSDGDDYIRMRIRIQNIGSGAVQNFVVQGEFRTLDNDSRNPRNVLVYGLLPGSQIEIHLEMDIPKNVTTRLITQLLVDGRMVHEKESTSTFP